MSNLLSGEYGFQQRERNQAMKRAAEATRSRLSHMRCREALRAAKRSVRRDGRTVPPNFGSFTQAAMFYGKEHLVDEMIWGERRSLEAHARAKHQAVKEN